MIINYNTFSELLAHGFDTVIDVRSPAEFAEDHIPGAINLPVLSDSERATVGTIYVQDSRFNARKIGGALVAQNASRHLMGPLAGKDGAWRPLVYCWRGGQRSGSFASILEQVGWRTNVIGGGYKTYRKMVVKSVQEDELKHQLILLEGNTGTAKTEVLNLLDGQGVQTLDLEGLAAHRGSVFGAVGTPQPSQKSFEGALAVALARLDPEKPVLLEAESSRIGRCQIPRAIWKAMSIAPRIRISAPISARADYLVRAYSDISQNTGTLKTTIQNLGRLQSKETISHWLELVDQGKFGELAQDLMLQHYDPRYAKSRDRSETRLLAQIGASSLGPDGLGEVVEKIRNVVSDY